MSSNPLLLPWECGLPARKGKNQAGKMPPPGSAGFQPAKVKNRQARCLPALPGGKKRGTFLSPLGRGAFFYPLSGGVAEGRGGFPQTYRRSRTHPAATRHKEEACPPTAKPRLDTFPLSLQGGELFSIPSREGWPKAGVGSWPARPLDPPRRFAAPLQGGDRKCHSLCQQTQEECSANAPIPNNRFTAKGERGPPDRAGCWPEPAPRQIG